MLENVSMKIHIALFWKKIKNAQLKHKQSNHKFLLNSRDFSVGTSSGAYIRQRLENDEIIKN